MFARIIALSLSLLLVQTPLLTHPFVSKAQRQSTASELESTIWEAEHPVIYSAALGERLKRQFDCRFGRQGKVTCDISVTMDGKLKSEYDPILRRLVPKYEPSHKEPLLRRIESGTYKQNGNSVHIDIPFAYKIDATIRGNRMSGEVTLVRDSNQRVPWIARRVSGGKESSTTSSDEDSLQQNDSVPNDDRGLAKQKKYPKDVEGSTVVIGNSKDAEAYYDRAESEFALEDYRGAVADYDQALRIYSAIDPNGEAILKAEADRKAKGGIGISKAILDLHLPFWYPIIYHRRGLAKEMLGDKVGACYDFRRSCELGGPFCLESKKHCQ